MGRWDARFPEIEVIALEEVNRHHPAGQGGRRLESFRSTRG